MVKMAVNYWTDGVEFYDKARCDFQDGWVDATPVQITQYEADRLAKQTEQEANDIRDKAMLTGIDYQGYMISLTDVDGNGMLQVKAAFEMGLPATTIHFKNGTKLPIDATDFPTFALWFVTERNRFFI